MSYEEEGIEGYFDSNREALNYFAGLERQKLRNRKGACEHKDNCNYGEDCPADWDLSFCLTKL